MSKNQKRREPYSVSQNFLTSRKTIDRLIRIAGLQKKDTVLEIGAGKGHLTKALSDVCGEVITYEIDRYLYEGLKEQLKPNVQLHYGNFLKCCLPKGRDHVFANIPFSITTGIVRKLTTASSLPQGMWLIMEKGAAKRFCGMPKETMASLLLKPKYDVKIVYHFQRSDFHLMPGVDIVMLEFRRKSRVDVSPAEWREYHDFLQHSLKYGIFGKNALLTKRQIETALKVEGLPQLKPTDDILYVQWLCLFRCWLRLGKRRR